VLAIGCGPGTSIANVDWGPRRTKTKSAASATYVTPARLAADHGRDHPGENRSRLPELTAVYVLNRRPEDQVDVQIESLQPASATFELLRNSFCSNMSTALQSSQVRIRLVAELANRCSIKRLTYGSNLEALSTVRRQLDLDIRRRLTDRAVSDLEPDLNLESALVL
jgi:hypothetical protein